MSEFVLFLPIYLAILGVIALVGYFYWKSTTTASDAEETLSLLDIVDKATDNIKKEVLKSVNKAIDIDKIATSVIETVIAILEAPENQEPLKQALSGLMGMGGLSKITEGEITTEIGENLVSTIYDQFGVVGEKILQQSLGENWEEKVKDNPRKAISILQGYANFGVFDLMASLQTKLQTYLPSQMGGQKSSNTRKNTSGSNW